MKIGIVGLPNVGKSTLFHALTKKEVARENYPFCTIEPNVGIVHVPDKRLEKLAEISRSKKITPAIIEFVDIAGLVKGAHKGEGLGNQFLTHIKEVDAIAHIVRAFGNKNIIHVEGSVNPMRDLETITFELVMKDLDAVARRMEGVEGKARTGDKESRQLLSALEQVYFALDSGKRADTANLRPEELLLLKNLNLLTLKPMLYVANSDDIENLPQWINTIAPVVVLNVQTESELADLSQEEVEDYVKELRLDDIGLNKLIRTSYTLLNLITFFTTGETETRAWTVKKGAKAPQAAGCIHSDMERGFIRAEVIEWDKLFTAQSWGAAREKAYIRLEGKEYTVQDGDVCYFRFSV